MTHTNPAPVTSSAPGGGPGKKEKTLHTSSRSGIKDSVLGTRNLLVTAALGVVGCLFVIPLSYLFGPGVLNPTLFVWLNCAFMGVWLIPYLLPAVIVRRPGAMIIAGFIMGVISAFTTPSGPGALAGNVLGAVFVGIAMAVTLYRFWSTLMFMICGAVFGALNVVMMAASMLPDPTAVKIAGMFVVAVASTSVGVLLTQLLKKAVNKAGVAVNNDPAWAASAAQTKK
ncbi:ECF transporter S component [Corynebacterium mendelii]|uniref:ECF transporter S component n=1 Tax=Corynebacterium mendelii TaxID=2765362 RepID=A0A939DYP9_9CORY|nr:ECF transporter S component [Corynebacterium mendelii]